MSEREEYSRRNFHRAGCHIDGLYSLPLSGTGRGKHTGARDIDRDDRDQKTGKKDRRATCTKACASVKPF